MPIANPDMFLFPITEYVMISRMWITSLPAFIIVFAGCYNSPQGGSPGTTDSFKISAPDLATTLKQGEKETVKLAIKRDSGFKKTVDLKSDAPAGLKVVMNSKQIRAEDPTDFSFTVEAAKTAAVGDHIIKVTATPETGTATTVDVKVKVTEGPKT
ncbi:hypothetical protein BH11PLA2_BH11PLA2_45610 [soil metagenome]